MLKFASGDLVCYYPAKKSNVYLRARIIGDANGGAVQIIQLVDGSRQTISVPASKLTMQLDLFDGKDALAEVA